MYEKSTGSLLLRIEQLESQNDSLQRQIVDAMFDRDVARNRYEREKLECDQQAHLVMMFAKRYEDERALTDRLAAALREESHLTTPLDATLSALKAYDEVRGG